MQALKIANKKSTRAGKIVDHKKIASAYGILRSKRLKGVKIQRTLRDEWR